jgi:SET domain-containing protein
VVKVQVRVSPSRIAGQGLFAAQEIQKGTRIIQYIGARMAKAESAERLAQGNAYLFAFNDRYDIDGKTLKNKARYLNR